MKNKQQRLEQEKRDILLASKWNTSKGNHRDIKTKETTENRISVLGLRAFQTVYGYKDKTSKKA